MKVRIFLSILYILSTSNLFINAQSCEIIHEAPIEGHFYYEMKQRSNGNLVFSKGKTLYEYDFQTLERILISEKTIRGFELGKNDDIWFYTNSELIQLNGDSTTIFNDDNSVIDGPIDDICVDHLGNVWASSYWGIFRKTDTLFVELEFPERITTIIEHEQTIWLGGDEKIFKYANDEFQHMFSFSGGITASMIFDSKNTLWVHTVLSTHFGSTVWYSNSLRKINEDGSLESFGLHMTVNGDIPTASNFNVCHNDVIVLVTNDPSKNFYVINENEILLENPDIQELINTGEIYHIDGADNLFVVGNDYIAQCPLQDCIATAIDNSFSNTTQQELIYPNPFIESLTINSNQLGPSTRVELYNLNGQLIQVLNIQADDQVMIDDRIPPGVYVLKILEEGQLEAAQRVVKINN